MLSVQPEKEEQEKKVFLCLREEKQNPSDRLDGLLQPRIRKGSDKEGRGDINLIKHGRKEKSVKSADAPEGKERELDARGKNNSEKTLKCLSCN